jgi:hypothetical protein
MAIAGLARLVRQSGVVDFVPSYGYLNFGPIVQIMGTDYSFETLGKTKGTTSHPI